MSDLIHCITNPISMMQCANAVLALGAKPMMAEHPQEVAEITATASALLLNLGNISDVRMESMRISFGVAMEKGIPVVIDAVGVSCSKLRREFVEELLRDYTTGLESEREQKTNQSFLLLKGNYSEILALRDLGYTSKGVDAEQGLAIENVIDAAKTLANQHSCLVLASGEADVITDGKEIALVHNGHPTMSSITGTGCMQGGICATYLAREASMDSVVDACACLGIAGEVAVDRLSSNADVGELGRYGCGSYLIALLDALSLMDDKTVQTRKRIQTLK